MRPWILLAGVNGLLAIGFAAYGAHGVEPHAGALMDRASLFQLIHAAALLSIDRLVVERRRLATLAGMLFTAGIVLFSGSLYLKALTGPIAVPLATPAGGIALMLGWLALAASALANARRRS
jgi:uncharacterized membrane protein YgdD (TMEM256/DUF423 family)